MRFLYYKVTELWGRRKTGRAGNEKTGASTIDVREEKPPYKSKV